MESDIMRLHTSSPPPAVDDEEDDDADGEMRSGEEEEFGNFRTGISCSPIGFADSSELPSSFRSPPPNIKPATHQPSCSFDQPVEQSQPTSTVMFECGRGQMDRQDGDAESSLRLTNGHAERRSVAHSAAGACSPQEETGFADFTVFTDQTAHPWCCGFSPVSSSEKWDSRLNGGTNISSGKQISDSGREVIMKFEPGSVCAHKTKENLVTKLKHCECRDAALVLSSQDDFVLLEAAEPFDFPSDMKEWDGDTQREDQENGVSAIPKTFMSEAASEDLPSFSDDLSFEGASTADLEPNVSSLISQDDSTDWDRTDDEVEELEDFIHSSRASLSPHESEEGFHHRKQHATQETSATSSQPQSEADPGDRFADFTDGSSERRGDRDHARPADAGVLSLGNLPPSDSFADFCSAPTQEDATGSWAQFKDQTEEVEGKTWTQFRESVSSPQTDVDAEEQASRVQQLLETSFPQVGVPAVEGEEELLSLGALLQKQHPPESEEEISQLSGARRIQQEMLRSHQDVHGAVGLRFQWGGSHVNSTLLSCLGVDTRNIVFMGTKKQPVTVPAFASGLGLLEPTKDPAPAASSPGRRVVTTGAPPGPRDLSAHPAQEFPSRQPDWSSRGLSSSQDGTSPRRAPHFWGRK
ncbi:uncharacterized protein LOC115399548 [Salarias fasciatus]|uniref:Uncharacterized LOC115399548 n=1 Tax=Salarias fasciatus TaxID=181472 RepID=A0A672GJ43_SALFA|nr:uncharacterized protein LOC115399548 [Salarias fasciatus]